MYPFSSYVIRKNNIETQKKIHHTMQIKQKLACANYLNFQSNLVSHHFQLFTCVAFYLKNIYEYEFL